MRKIKSHGKPNGLFQKIIKFQKIKFLLFIYISQNKHKKIIALQIKNKTYFDSSY